MKRIETQESFLDFSFLKKRFLTKLINYQLSIDKNNQERLSLAKITALNSIDIINLLIVT
ncbi:hypothetical protein PCC7424_4584 [Gloeothece citriformis PCC 7424]|uniref:Uncharacterized protein n=1 Tax=Gloeothece citriformis (strain PCC 7424) TaxID=65393 RepID=B7KAH2_GLOC7|nr:hypothetical protein PCC7424_4584 [Gloeothece citriformis PCC 7424]